MSVDGDGNIIVADRGNSCLRKVASGLPPPLPVPCPRSEHAVRLEALLSDDSLSDAIFVVGDTRIHARRLDLITHSEYFRAMLTAGSREGQEPPAKRARTSGKEAATEITFGDTIPEAFRALLLYTQMSCALRTSSCWT
jgi:hypothetical protein